MNPFSLFSRRVPLSISLPIIVACTGAGFIASTLRSASPPTGAPQAPRQASVATSTVEQPRRITEMQPFADLTQPRVPRVIALPPLDQTALPMPAVPALAGLERDAQVPNPIVTPAPLPVAESPPQRTRATPVKRSVSDTHRPQRMAQQRPSAPSKSSTGLKNIPLIGSVFSLLQ